MDIKSFLFFKLIFILLYVPFEENDPCSYA